MTKPSAYQAVGRRVIQQEAAALETLGAALGAEFDTAVERILGSAGRVLVSGIGKSGHIARKIAATLASTGTPAHFIHPSEASHGDLGMVRPDDIVFAISNSGEAPELANLVAFSRRFGNCLIGLSAKPESSLMAQADIKLVLPSLGEACGHGVVPTISTTMALAMGDALAIALMEARAFTAEHFREFHPGGKLGARLARVGDLMHAQDALPLAGPLTPMSDVLLTISQKGFGVAGVLDEDGKLAGVITDGDLRRHMDGLLDRTANEVMTQAPQTIGPGALAEEAVAVMNEAKITSLFVVDQKRQGKVLGILHIHDCLRAGVV